jgi:hypothetical protein
MKLDIILPTTLSEIPLVRYQKFIEMKEQSNDDEFIANKMIQIFCSIELRDVMSIKMKDLNELIEHFTKVFQEKPKFKTRFKIKDIEFGFIPKLDDISFGEYVDLENHLQNWKTYHKAMAVMYRPIKEEYQDKYSIVDYEPNEDMQELMKFAPLDVAISASVFFYNLGSELLNLTMSYLQNEVTKMTHSLNTQKEQRSDEDDAFAEYSERAQFARNWNWYPSIYKCAQGDVSKLNEVTKLRLTQCLTYLTFEKQKTEIENRELKRQMKR